MCVRTCTKDILIIVFTLAFVATFETCELSIDTSIDVLVPVFKGDWRDAVHSSPSRL